MGNPIRFDIRRLQDTTAHSQKVSQVVPKARHSNDLPSCRWKALSDVRLRPNCSSCLSRHCHFLTGITRLSLANVQGVHFGGHCTFQVVFLPTDVLGCISCCLFEHNSNSCLRSSVHDVLVYV